MHSTCTFSTHIDWHKQACVYMCMHAALHHMHLHTSTIVNCMDIMLASQGSLGTRPVYNRYIQQVECLFLRSAYICSCQKLFQQILGPHYWTRQWKLLCVVCMCVDVCVCVCVCVNGNSSFVTICRQQLSLSFYFYAHN